MKALCSLALTLLSAGMPILATIIVIAIAVALVGPIHLNLSIGSRTGHRGKTADHWKRFL